MSEPKGYSRRQFLQGAAVGTAGTLVLSGGAAALLWPDAPESAPSQAPAPAPAPAPEKVTPLPYAVPTRGAGPIMVDAARCVGCRICESECAIFHGGAADLANARIRVYYFNPPVDVPVVCQQCGDAPCTQVCPPKALTKNMNTGALDLDAAKCVGCWKCVDACSQRSGALRRDEARKTPAGICDLCGGKPQCVRVCPTGALSRAVTGVDGKYIAAPAAQVAADVARKLYGV